MTDHGFRCVLTVIQTNPGPVCGSRARECGCQEATPLGQPGGHRTCLCRLGCCSRQGSHVRITVEKHVLPTRGIPSSCGEGNLVARCFLQFLSLAPLSIFFSPEKSPLSPLSSQTSQPRRPCPSILSLPFFLIFPPLSFSFSFSLVYSFSRKPRRI